jgi:hypothetical protein
MLIRPSASMPSPGPGRQWSTWPTSAIAPCQGQFARFLRHADEHAPLRLVHRRLGLAEVEALEPPHLEVQFTGELHGELDGVGGRVQGLDGGMVSVGSP